MPRTPESTNPNYETLTTTGFKEKILNMAKARSHVEPKHIISELEISDKTARRYLSQMVLEGFLNKQGFGKYTFQKDIPSIEQQLVSYIEERPNKHITRQELANAFNISKTAVTDILLYTPLGEFECIHGHGYIHKK